MPIHDLGYRNWNGTLVSTWSRWTVIAHAGIQRAWQSRWLRRMLFFAWLPAIWFGLGFFLWEHSLDNPRMRRSLEPFLMSAPEMGMLDGLVEGLAETYRVEDEEVARHSVWSWLLYTFFRHPQSVIMVLMVGIIAPSLISQDVRSRAFLLYFSRPVDRWQYALGKLTTIWVYLAMISAVPALALYMLGVLLSPNLQVIEATWDLPLRIVAASAVLMIPTAALASCISSLTQESRYAGFGWFAVWIFGWFTYNLMTSLELEQGESLGKEALQKWSLVSLYHTLGEVQGWVFGFTDFNDVRRATMILGILAVVSLIVLFRRISAPLRA